MNQKRLTIEAITDPDELLDWVADRAINTGPLIETSGSVRAMLEWEVAHLHKVGFLQPPAVSAEYLRAALAAMARPTGSFLCNEGIPAMLAEFMNRNLLLEEPIELHEVVLFLADIAGLNLTVSDDPSRDDVLIQAEVASGPMHHTLVRVQLERQLRKLGRG
ncbi:MAG: hypothetical protein EOQ52_07025 [Mesorhizobium sp.]|uniref:hypothetical protein n=1 Tax=Mesorhizobium sp. TaxID=1871066 RepID=UPI000FE73E61|nr:hypothetical protein [Mesorhizobium sp.]RWB91171.1 MAG: hypothetical protein EOQ52_07025 [Mesorhizobium sp.]